MPKSTSLIRVLAQYALSKKGAELDTSCCPDPLQEPHIALAHVSWGDFFEVDQDEGTPVARLPVLKEALERHRRKYPAIGDTGWMERDGHVYMNVPLDADLPVAFLFSLIDDAYDLVWNKLDSQGRLLIDLAQLPYDESMLLNRLIDAHSLKEHRKEIRKLVRPGMLLRTKKTSEPRIPLGATKIGGRPDLPAQAEWPAYRNGKPLAFLAQIDLAEIARLGTPMKGLPARGLLSVFSAWGWMEEGDADPHPPPDSKSLSQEEDGWTVILHTPTRAGLRRRRTPHGVNSFRSAAVEPAAIRCLPNHREEPPFAALRWSTKLWGRYDEMQSDFRSLQMRHWFEKSDAGASCHLLGGYALFQQVFEKEVLEKRLAMFLQVGTDDNTEMCWGDGGELTFYADARGLSRGRFERLWGTCQCG